MLKKNLFGIIIVALIAAAFAGGYVVGRKSSPQISAAQKMAMMGGQRPPEGGQRPGAGGNPPAGEPTAQKPQADEPAQSPKDASAQQPQATTKGAPGGGGGLGGGDMTEEMRAALTKAREEGKSREEIQALMARLREKNAVGQAPPEKPQPAESAPTPDANTQTFYGTAAPLAEVNVQSKQGGTIITLNGKEGDAVQQGDVLVRFDDGEQQLNLEQSRSSKNATLQQVQQAQTNVKSAKTNLNRNRELFKDGLISQQQMDNLQNAVDAAQSSLNSARENANQADTQIALLEKGLENFVVHAPISGIIDGKNYNLQEIYRANDVLYHIVNIDEVYVNVDVPETYIKQIREGMPVAVIFNALGEQTFSGILETVLPSGTTSNRTFTVKVLVKNPGQSIKPGMFASVAMVLSD